MGDVTVEGVISGLLKTQKLFQNGKSVLPGSLDLKHESGISVDIICGVAVLSLILKMSSDTSAVYHSCPHPPPSSK
jgi:hypothetical protein